VIRTIPLRLALMTLILIVATACNLAASEEVFEQQRIAQQATATETIPPSTPLPTLTPSNTLRPPPTFEPPTITPSITPSPTITPTPTIDISVSIPGLLGLPTPTDESEPQCEPRDDWELRYRVQPNDALARIAEMYNTWPNVLAEGNCLEDPNMIVVGHELRVPGEAHPLTPEFVCVPWELLTPFNGAVTIPGEGQITFNWRGPQSPRYLIRLYRPRGDGELDQVAEILVEMRQNQTFDLAEIPEAGLYYWRVYPLGGDFRQIPCEESYLSQFSKAAGPPATQLPSGSLP
jgi:LysM repeat protein